MICVHCSHDSKYPERQKKGGRCPRCDRTFAFEPRAGDRISDLGFQRAIDAVSANGTLRWGVEHLYYEVCRRLGGMTRGQRLLRNVLLGILAVCALALAIKRAWVPVAIAVAIGAWVYRLPRRRRRRLAKLSRADFDRMWSRWTTVHPDRHKNLIVRKEPVLRPRAAEPDIPLYSFDRAVICDHARTVDLLLANNFHFENNCAVLSIDGYPQGPFFTVLTMLRRNPKLDVFALHDATAAGCRMAYRLATEDQWFKGQARVIDVGLRPTQAQSFRGVLLPASAGRVVAGAGITAPDAVWLSSFVLELAAIRPEQVLKRLYRAINAAAANGSGSDAGGGSGGGEGDGSGAGAGMGAGGGAFGGAGASGDFSVDEASFSTDAGDSDGSDGDGGSG